jgi:hypothetical protein
MSEQVSATPNVPSYTPPITPSQKIKVATPDIILFDDASVPIEVMTDLIFEDIGGHELINIARFDTINGQNISYQPIKNLSLINQQYNPNNIVGLQKTSNLYFSGFAIKLEDKIPRLTNSPDNNPVYMDSLGNIVVEAINLNIDDQIEIQIIVSGTIYEAEFGESAS